MCACSAEDELCVCVLAQIGVILRDSNGIAQVKSVTGTKVLRILKKNGTQRSSGFVFFAAAFLGEKADGLCLVALSSRRAGGFVCNRTCS